MTVCLLSLSCLWCIPAVRPQRVVAAAAFVVEAKQNSLRRQRTAETARVNNKSRKSEVATRMKKVFAALDGFKAAPPAAEADLAPVQTLINQAYQGASSQLHGRWQSLSGLAFAVGSMQAGCWRWSAAWKGLGFATVGGGGELQQPGLQRACGQRPVGTRRQPPRVTPANLPASCSGVKQHADYHGAGSPSPPWCSD